MFKNVESKIIISSLFGLMLLGCYGSFHEKDMIFIKIKLVDRHSNKSRINSFDTVELRVQGFGYLMRGSELVSTYVTDSMGVIKIQVDTTENYILSAEGNYVSGSLDLIGKDLKNDKEYNFKVRNHRYNY